MSSAIKVDKINVSVEEDEHEPFTGMVCGIFGCIALRDGGGGIRSFHVRWPLTYIFFLIEPDQSKDRRLLVHPIQR